MTCLSGNATWTGCSRFPPVGFVSCVVCGETAIRRIALLTGKTRRGKGIMQESIGAFIRGRRKSLGITQEQLGYDARIDQSDLSKYERDKQRPGAKVIERLAAALQVDPSAFPGSGA